MVRLSRSNLMTRTLSAAAGCEYSKTLGWRRRYTAGGRECGHHSRARSSPSARCPRSPVPHAAGRDRALAPVRRNQVDFGDGAVLTTPIRRSRRSSSVSLIPFGVNRIPRTVRLSSLSFAHSSRCSTWAFGSLHPQRRSAGTSPLDRHRRWRYPAADRGLAAAARSRSATRHRLYRADLNDDGARILPERHRSRRAAKRSACTAEDIVSTMKGIRQNRARATILGILGRLS